MSTMKPSGAQTRKKQKRQKTESQHMSKALQNWLNPTDSTPGREQDAYTSCISSQLQEDGAFKETYDSETEANIRQNSETDVNEDQQSHELDAAELEEIASEDNEESSNEN